MIRRVPLSGLHEDLKRAADWLAQQEKVQHEDCPQIVGPEHPPLVVAEIGINHGGDLEVAKHMVRCAHQAGCEIVKHQTHFIEDEMTEEAKGIFPPNADVSIWDVMAKCALSAEDEFALKTYAESLGMIYISTPFSRKAADFLNEIDVPGLQDWFWRGR